MQRDLSRGSLMNRDGSANRLVEDTHLGPQMMKKKISSMNSAQRPISKMKQNGPTPGASSRAPDQNSEEDYDEGGFDDVNEDAQGVDEMA